MRTTLDLDPDLYRAAKSLARSQGRSLGKVVSELALRGLAPRRETTRRGFPVFRVADGAPPLTPDQVRRALDDEP